MKSTVALYGGSSRVQNLRQTVEHVIDEIDWSGTYHVIVKPNLVVAHRPYAITHRDALATLLSAIRDRYTGPLTIAEGCAVDSTSSVFEQQRYPELARHYDCRLLDLNSDDTVDVHAIDRRGDRRLLGLSRTMVECDCRISLAVPKTHDTVLVTLAIKNLIMASLVDRRLTSCRRRAGWMDRLGQLFLGHGNGWGSDKAAMHQGFPMMNINLARLAPLVWPHLGILDGYIAMEGAGPVDGDPVPMGVALASTDSLALDTTAAELMGYRLSEVGYLHYCAQLGLGNAAPQAIEVAGNVLPQSVARCFRPHPTHTQQRQWRSSKTEQLLGAGLA